MKLTEESYVECAELAIKNLCKREDGKRNYPDLVTTSKIRNLLAMTASIYNEVLNCQSEELSKDLIGRINYLKIRFVYEAGRETQVRKLIEEADILAALDEIRGKRSRYILFSRYMEALVAYRKFYGNIYGNRDE